MSREGREDGGRRIKGFGIMPRLVAYGLDSREESACEDLIRLIALVRDAVLVLCCS